jgi:hypothetical protein
MMMMIFERDSFTDAFKSRFVALLHRQARLFIVCG